MKFKKDNRDKLWAKIELSIQKRGSKKDRQFKLSGKWKKLVKRQGAIKIYAVNGEYVRSNLSIIFSHGGHGYVHEFIPADEIWVETNHFEGCVCKKRNMNEKVSKNFFDSTVLHELVELKEMRSGMPYWKAHQIALQKEEEAGLLKSPYSDL